ncbi:AAA family ATPase [bacterium]|nr:AAA family ATPase [bacterium]
MTTKQKLAIQPAKLRYFPALKRYKGKTTADIVPAGQEAFQERGFEALKFGVSIAKKGFNIFVSGEAGTGKTSNTKLFLEQTAHNRPTPQDICYVHNFEDGDKPLLITLPAGDGVDLIKEMAELLDLLQDQIPRQLESEQFETLQTEVEKEYRLTGDSLHEQLSAAAKKLGFVLQPSQNGLVINPVVKGKPITREDFDKLSDKMRVKIKKNEEKLQEQIIAYFHAERKLEKESKEKVRFLRREYVKLIIKEPLKDIRKAFRKSKGLTAYLLQLENHILDTFFEFILHRDVNEGKIEAGKIMPPDFMEYKVNLLISNKNTKGAPVIYETNPTYQNLMGFFEYEEVRNTFSTNFTKMKPGALHRANGGFLIIQADDLLKNIYAWNAFKRVIRNKSLTMDDTEGNQRYRINSMPSPTPLPLDVKIILLGTDQLYHMLYDYDPDFRRIFRVKADFSTTTPITTKTTTALIGFITRVVQKDCDIPFNQSALQRLLFHSSRMAGDQKKFKIHAGGIVDILMESSYWAHKNHKKIVTEDEVVLAIKAKEERHARFRKSYYESIIRGNILIDVSGADIGQINGLAVYSIGDFSFGIPSRITARVFSGQRGLINIDREARLSGAIHDKGALILGGFLGDLFAQDKPLSITATIAFEQSYGGVDGDSASSTELYSLLSALSELPINQGIAVTGSINQMGDIQPIGGVNEKVEGFFSICKLKGLTGTQGVMIPIQNVENLNLNDEVVDAIREGLFSLYAIKNVKQGIEVLTGVSAGNRLKDGTFTKDSVFDLADKRIRSFNEI